ncbi:hypothetical protein BKA70DRAFT_1238864 [Coprinopsis sp. MPI-PUGE-AT-0042]|nr:hypothetical protein BKA70DRAFT_1238864 [Coprinopsis sp. MPI-PUGE-AT-0042]
MATFTKRAPKQGVPARLYELGTAITARNYTLPVLDAAFLHLYVEDAWYSRTNQKDLEERLQLAFSAIGCVSQVTRALQHSHPLKGKTVTRLFDHAEGVIFWANILLANCQLLPNAYHDGSAEFCMMFAGYLKVIVDFDSSIRTAIFSSPRYPDVILWLWSTGMVIPTTNYRDIGESLVVTLMSMLLEHPNGRLLITERLATNANVLDHGASMATITKTHGILLTIYGALQSSPPICAALLQRNCLRGWMLELTALEGHGATKELFCLCLLFLDSASHSLQPLTSMSQFLEGGALSVVQKGLENDSVMRMMVDDQHKRRIFKIIMGSLGVISCYPRVMTALGPSLMTLPDLCFKATGTMYQEVIDTWNFIRTFWKAQCALFKRTMGPGVTAQRPCDNFQRCAQVGPKHNITGQKVFNVPKACSGCKMVWYCCVECQKEDWKEGHRNECNQMDYSWKANEGLRYLQTTKKFHVAIARESFVSRFSRCEEVISRHHSMIHPNDIIVVLNLPNEPKVELLDDW